MVVLKKITRMLVNDMIVSLVVVVIDIVEWMFIILGIHWLIMKQRGDDSCVVDDDWC